MRVENGGILCANRLGDTLLHLQNLHACLNKSRFETPNLVRDLRSFDAIAYDFIGIFADDMNHAAGDSGGNACAVKPYFFSPLIAAHPPARLTEMSIFVEARLD